MSWNEIKDRIHEPIMEPRMIEAILRSCMKKDGKNMKHSRTIKMEDYVEPINDESSIDEDTIEGFKYDIIRYMAQSLLKDVPPEDRARWASPISNYMDLDGFDRVLVGDLVRISQMSNDRIAKLLNEKSGINSCVDFIKEVYRSCCDFEAEHNGANPPYHVKKASSEEKNSLWGYNKRIYLNRPRKNISTYRFLLEYIKKCIDARIPFDTKGFGSFSHGEDSLDGMILYSNNHYFDEHIDILEQVIKENPELIDTFGTPISTGGMVIGKDGNYHYAIASGMPLGGKNDAGEFVPGTYNDYIDYAINFTYTVACSKLIQENMPLLRSIGESSLSEDELMEAIKFFGNIEEVPSHNLRKSIFNIRANEKQKENAMKIRELAYKVIDFKEMTGKEDIVMKKMKEYFSGNFRMVCSVLKFNDKDHLDTPIYQDESFIDFVEEHESKKISGHSEPISREI